MHKQGLNNNRPPNESYLYFKKRIDIPFGLTKNLHGYDMKQSTSIYRTQLSFIINRTQRSNNIQLKSSMK